MSVAYEHALEALKARLGDSALRHSIAVANTAAELAEAYDCDVAEARLAGLLHDWSKGASDDELLGAARELGVPVTDVDVDVPYLLHAPVGAALLRREMPEVGESVIRAIAAHTYGAGAMGPLDMIVYIADTIEPGRVHDGVGALREAVGEVTLTELFTRAYASSLVHLVESRRRLHPGSVEMWNRLVSEQSR